MKALRKQLIAAIAMTLVAAVALGSSTYAWFANNATVNATGMSMTAKSDVGYMLIAQGHQTLDYVKANGSTSATFENTGKAMYPANHRNVTTPTSKIEDYDKAANWYYEYSSDTKSSAGTGKKDIAADKLEDFVLINEFSICAQTGSNSLSDLKISDLDLGTAGESAVKVIVASDTASDEFTIGDNQTSTVVLDSLVTPNEVTYIRVYAFWDGSNASVYTENKANLKETTLSMSLTAVPMTE